MSTEHFQMLIDGVMVDAENAATFESVNPATGKVWATIPAASENDVNKAVTAASRAFENSPWASMLPTERGRLLRNLATLLAEHSEELGRLESIDTGKLFNETRWQARYIAQFFDFYGGLADKVTGETLPIDKPDMMTLTTREPLGVVAAVVPWNSQLFLVAVKLGPALAAGNTVVLKASEQASAAMLKFGELIEAAGFPPGVVNIVSGFAEPCGRALTQHPQVARISFTGGPENARHIVRNAAENLAQVSLELGGKSPVIVFDDADLESAVNGCMASIFGASGQSCVAGSRIYLHDKIYDRFLDSLTSAATSIVLGDPMSETTQMGPLCTRRQLELCEQQVEKATTEGGTIRLGGRRSSGTGDGWFYEPTIVECPDQDMEIVRTELFGPVLAVLRFHDENEVVAKANDTRFGLAAGIFTRNISRALRVQKQVRAGIVWINTYRVVSPIAEFGGFKDSGFGRESGAQAIYDYTRTRTLWINTSDAPMGNPFVMR